MRSPPRVPTIRIVNIVDLPFEALNQILNFIKNIREKIRLMRTCKSFYNVILIHLSRVSYGIVNRDDYLYQSEIEQGNLLKGKIVNLSRLLKLAPRLTHYTDKLNQIYFDIPQSPDSLILKPLSLKHLRYLHVNHCRTYFSTLNREHQYDQRIDLFLSDAPLLQTLHITVDRPINFILPRTETLRTFHLDYFLDAKYNRVGNKTISKAPIPCYGVIDGSAPNLSELKIHVKYMDAYVQLNDILRRASLNCPKLIYLSITFQSSTWPLEREGLEILGYGNWNLPLLRIVEIRGLRVPWHAWNSMFYAFPKLMGFYHDKQYYCDRFYHILGERNLYCHTENMREYMFYVMYMDKSLYAGRFLGVNFSKDRFEASRRRWINIAKEREIEASKKGCD